MPPATEFRDLIRRVRIGDEDAAMQLVRDYEPYIRRAARFRLRDPRIRRVFDSLDICQAVLLSFFGRAAEQQYDLETPDQLIKLLVTMARFKAGKKVRDEHAERRDVARLAGDPVEDRQTADSTATPSQKVSVQELVGKARDLLSADEWRLLQMRNEGHDWAAVAAACDASPEALRKQLERALARVRSRLALDDTQ